MMTPVYGRLAYTFVHINFLFLPVHGLAESLGMFSLFTLNGKATLFSHVTSCERFHGIG